MPNSSPKPPATASGPSPSPETSPPRPALHGPGGTLLICVLLTALTFAIYWPVGRHGFINYDDPDYVSANARVQAGLTTPSIHWAFTSYFSSNWHPLTWLSHMLDCQLFGLNPGAHHLVSVGFHAANSILVFLLLRALFVGGASDPTGAALRAAVVAALFAAHPLHVESVAWIAERKDVLSTFFGLLALWCYAAYARPANPPAPGAGPSPRRSAARVSFYTASLLCFASGLLCKPMLVTLPCLMLLLDFWPLGRFSWPPWRVPFQRLRPVLLEKVPFFLLTAASSVVTFWVQKASGAVVPMAAASFQTRLANAFSAWFQYVEKTFWPVDLAVFYPYQAVSWDSPEVLGGLLLVGSVTAGVVWAARRRPYLLVGWLWFLGALVPVIGLVQVGKQALADRYTYLPHVGLFVALVWGIGDLLARLRPAPPALAPSASPPLPRPTGLSLSLSIAAVAVCALLAARQVSFWRDSKTLFTHTAAVTANNFVAAAVLANALIEEGKFKEAIAECQRALAWSPEYAEALNTLGNAHARLREFDAALDAYRSAIRFDPGFAAPHHGLAAALLQLNRPAEAEAEAREAIRLEPDHRGALLCLAQALHSQGKFEAAADIYHRLISLDPKLFSAHRGLANVLVALKRLEEAATELEAAAALNTADVSTLAALGVVRLDQGRLDEAERRFTQVTQLQATNAFAHNQLALIHQARKQTAEAIASYRSAIASQPEWAEPLNNLAWLLAASANPAARNGAEAVDLAQRACKVTDYRQPVLLGTLAAAYAEAGRFAEAVATAEKARNLALTNNLPEIAKRNDELLQLYRAGQPFHESE